jgi:hypothetical protein
MSNPIYNALGNTPNNNNIMQQFLNFKKQMNGKNPQEEINNLLKSGRVSQEQLNQVQQMAMQMQGLFK